MQVNISGHQLEVTDALRDYVIEKFGRLERHFDKITNVQVVMQVEKLKQQIDATLHVAGGEVGANAEHEDMYAAIDLLVDKLDRQLIKHKEKNIDRQQGAAVRFEKIAHRIGGIVRNRERRHGEVPNLKRLAILENGPSVVHARLHRDGVRRVAIREKRHRGMAVVEGRHAATVI